MYIVEGDIIRIFYNDIEYILQIIEIASMTVVLKKISASYGAEKENKFYYMYNEKIIKQIENDTNKTKNENIKKTIFIRTKTNSFKHILNTNNMRISKSNFYINKNDIFIDDE
jgi:hypothetical protein